MTGDIPEYGCFKGLIDAFKAYKVQSVGRVMEMASFAVDEVACPRKTGFSSIVPGRAHTRTDQVKGPELVDLILDLARDGAKWQSTRGLAVLVFDYSALFQILLPPLPHPPELCVTIKELMLLRSHRPNAPRVYL